MAKPALHPTLESLMKPELLMGALICALSLSYIYRAGVMRGNPDLPPHRWLIEFGKFVGMFVGGLGIMLAGLK